MPKRWKKDEIAIEFVAHFIRCCDLQDDPEFARKLIACKNLKLIWKTLDAVERKYVTDANFKDGCNLAILKEVLEK